MKLKNVRNATYIDYEKYSEMWSYRSLVCKHYQEECGIVFYEDYDFSKTTAMQLNKWFSEYLGIEAMDTSAKREKAIKDGTVLIGQRKYKVILRNTKD